MFELFFLSKIILKKPLNIQLEGMTFNVGPEPLGAGAGLEIRGSGLGGDR